MRNLLKRPKSEGEAREERGKWSYRGNYNMAGDGLCPSLIILGSIPLVPSIYHHFLEQSREWDLMNIISITGPKWLENGRYCIWGHRPYRVPGYSITWIAGYTSLPERPIARRILIPSFRGVVLQAKSLYSGSVMSPRTGCLDSSVPSNGCRSRKEMKVRVLSSIL